MSLNFFDAQTTCIGLLGLIATQDSLRALLGLVSCVIWMFDMAIPFRGVTANHIAVTIWLPKSPSAGSARKTRSTLTVTRLGSGHRVETADAPTAITTPAKIRLEDRASSGI